MNIYPESAKLAWKPLQSAAGNFDSYYLAETKTGQLAFRATRLAFLFSGGFMLIGFILGFMMYWDMSGEADFLSKDKFILLIPFAFTLVGCVMLYFSMQEKLFSLSEGVYHTGRGEDILLIYVSGLQILNRRVNNNGTHYSSYQLNLVYEDNSRKNVVSYANKENAMRDSEKLASYLGLKLWSNLDNG